MSVLSMSQEARRRKYAKMEMKIAEILGAHPDHPWIGAYSAFPLRMIHWFLTAPIKVTVPVVLGVWGFEFVSAFTDSGFPDFQGAKGGDLGRVLFIIFGWLMALLLYVDDLTSDKSSED